MKQTADQRPALNLDDLERQLREAVEPKRTFADDPLAELARIVKQDDPLRSVGGASNAAAKSVSFDDFLKAPPRSASGVMPEHTPRIEPLFADIGDLKTSRAASERDMPESADVEVLEAAAAQEDIFVKDAEVEHEKPEETGDDEAALALRPEFKDDFSVFQDEFDIEASIKSAVAPLPAADDLPSISAEAPAAAEQPKAQFDDMLAEFEAAMRGAGGEPALQKSVPSLEPIVMPPPPVDTAYNGPSLSGLGMGAAAAGAVAMGMAGSAPQANATQVSPANDAAYTAPARPAKSRRGLMIAAGVVGVAVIGMGSLLGMGSSMRKSAPANAPVIVAKPGVTKERPANPGGVEVPNQDKEVLQARPQTAAVERVAPREEQPVDLEQAQRRVQSTAETPSAATPSTASATSAVRQIPGVAIVAPVTTAAETAPAPRPVASVPITIAGQPAPVATPPVAASTPAPSAVPSAPAASAAPTPLTPSTSAPVTAPPLRTATLASPPAEPRRVRAVPIRPEGEPAPSRAQTQPRIVPAAPPAPGVRPAPEPADANAPLRITPSANRAQPQRVASAQPAAAAPAERTASSSGNFTVQLAAEGSSDSARAKFNRIRGQHSSVIGNYEPDIRTAEVNGKSVYRVRVGSFSREEAVNVCERLKANGGTCFVARN